ncbi:hemin uptake protein HemP [Nitratireductor mangrovi]|uniref:hemin uptake protein HemP n=1 Tax=Nitratireductor mangrovi TaxID=2599600 RepID=UPI001FED7EC9|nr:hemin uptake protein HemP [Nitratireductor mangrovi]
MNTDRFSFTSYRNDRRDGASARAVHHDPESLRTLSSESLFDGEHEIGIKHAGALYRLKITRQGKLILNK